MLGLPVSTEVKKALPKEQLYRQFDWKPSQRESFDGDVSRINFVNWISPRTLPGLTAGEEVKEIFVVVVDLKCPDFDERNIELLAKSIPQRIIYALKYGNEVRLALFHAKLFISERRPADTDFALLSRGNSMDKIWENIVTSIGQFKIEEQHTLTEQIADNEEHAKLERKIRLLESKLSSTRQPRKKRELYLDLQKLKQLSNGSK